MLGPVPGVTGKNLKEEWREWNMQINMRQSKIWSVNYSGTDREHGKYSVYLRQKDFHAGGCLFSSWKGVRSQPGGSDATQGSARMKMPPGWKNKSKKYPRWCGSVDTAWTCGLKSAETRSGWSDLNIETGTSHNTPWNAVKEKQDFCIFGNLDVWFLIQLHCELCLTIFYDSMRGYLPLF